MDKLSQPLCTSSDIASCDPGDLVKMPVKLFTRRTFTVPMKADDVEANFPPEFELFRSTGPTQQVITGGQTTVDSNLLGGDEVPCPFLMCGVCVQLTPEFDAWSVNGAVVDSTVAGNTGPDTPDYDGSIPFVGAAAGRWQGTLEHGGATQRAAVEFLLAYNLRFMLQCKYEMFDVPLADIGCVDSAGNFQGSGDCLVPAGPGIRKANDQYKALGLKSRFLPPTTIPAGPGGDPAKGFAAAPTTRVMRGGPKLQGNLAGFYLCPAPILLAPCCRINMSLHTGTSEFHLNRLKAEMGDASVDSPKGYGPEWTSGLVTGSVVAGAANVRTMKIGIMDASVTLIGYNLTSAACKQYFQMGIPESLLEVYSGIGNMPGMRLGGARGAPAPPHSPSTRTSPFLSPLRVWGAATWRFWPLKLPFQPRSRT